MVHGAAKRHMLALLMAAMALSGCVDGLSPRDLVVSPGETLRLASFRSVEGSVVVEEGARLVLHHAHLDVGEDLVVRGELVCSNSSISLRTGAALGKFHVAAGAVRCHDSRVTGVAALDITDGLFAFTNGDIRAGRFHLDGGNGTLLGTWLAVPRDHPSEGEAVRVSSGHLRVVDTSVPGRPIHVAAGASARFINVALGPTQFTGAGTAEVGWHLHAFVKRATDGSPVPDATVTLQSLSEDGLEESRGATDESGHVRLDIIEYAVSGGPAGLRSRNPHEVAVAGTAARSVVTAVQHDAQVVLLVPPGA